MREGICAISATSALPSAEGEIAHPSEEQRDESERGDLAGERLGAGDSHLGARVHVDPAVGFPCDRGADHVHHAQRPDPSLLRISRSAIRVSAVSPDWLTAM